VAGIQTFGQLVHWHPHIHALVTEGAFTPDLSACSHAQAGGTFLPLPDIDGEPFLRLWEHKPGYFIIRSIRKRSGRRWRRRAASTMHKASPASPSLPVTT